MPTEVKLTKNEKTLIERCINDPARFTYSPCPNGKGHARLVRSNMSTSQRKHLDRLAGHGFISRAVDGDAAKCPPETHVIYSATALGREEVDWHAPVEPLKRFYKPASDSQLLDEANVRD